MRILYFGDGFLGSTSAQRAEALKRLGHRVELLDPYKAFQKNFVGLRGSLNFRSGYRLLQSGLEKWLKNETEKLQRPDIIWVDMGELFGRGCLEILKSLSCPIVLYNIDDPTGGRDGRRFDLLLRSIKSYDVIVVVRNSTRDELVKLGAKRVIRVFRNYDEVMHRPFDSLQDIPQNLRSEVVFVGTWMRYEKRDEFLLRLIEKGVPVSIWGDRWQKSPNFEKLKANWRGNALYGRDYVAAIQGSKICIGMLSKGNRDDHTTRSLEVPFAGGLLCAERTDEHLELYEENVEAVFWKDADECASVCLRLLNDEAEREQIRKNGMRKVRSLKLGHEDLCREILEHVMPVHA